MFYEQHYEAVADSLEKLYRRHNPKEKSVPKYWIYAVIDELCCLFQLDNPDFDARKFTAACGYDLGLRGTPGFAINVDIEAKRKALRKVPNEKGGAK